MLSTDWILGQGMARAAKGQGGAFWPNAPGRSGLNKWCLDGTKKAAPRRMGPNTSSWSGARNGRGSPHGFLFDTTPPMLSTGLEVAY